MNNIISSKEYYVYIYFFPEVGEFKYGDYVFNWKPFYVGKGKGDRLFHHMQPHHLEKIHKKSEIIKNILSQNLIPVVNINP
jgi:hypothetical protein